MSSIKQLHRGILFGLAILAGSFALAAPSQAQAATGLQPIELKASDIEDWWPDTTDEAQLSYGGQTWRGSVSQGIPANGPFPVARFSGSSMTVELREWDGSSPRFLTSRVIYPGALNSYQSVPLVGDGYSYTLLVKFVWVEDAPVVQPPLNVTLRCEATGDEQMTCSASASGGTGPYVLRWEINGYDAGTGTHISGSCGADGDYVNVKVHATDMNGRSGSRSTSFHCLSHAL